MDSFYCHFLCDLYVRAIEGGSITFSYLDFNGRVCPHVFELRGVDTEMFGDCFFPDQVVRVDLSFLVDCQGMEGCLVPIEILRVI